MGGMKREEHGSIRHYAAHWRSIPSGVVEAAEEVHERAKTVELGGTAEGGDIGSHIQLVISDGLEAIGYGLETEGWEAVKSIGSPGFQQSPWLSSV